MTAHPATTPGRIAIAVLFSIGIASGIALRTTPLAGAFLFGDELHSLGALSLPWSVLAGRYDAVGSGLLLPLTQKGLVTLFGASLPVLRAVAFVPSVLLIAAVHVLARREGDAIAARGAALLVALTPVLIFYGHFGRSYSLAALLCVGVQIVCSDRASEGEAESGDEEAAGVPWGRVAPIAVLGGLAIYAHLVSVFFLLGLAVGVGARMVAEGGLRRLPVHPATIGLAGAGLLGLFLHWPALDSLLAFVGQKSDQVYQGSFGPIDVIRVMAGSWPAAWAATAALLLSAVAEARRRGFAAAPLLASVFVPPLVLWAVSPYGDAYAWARYLLPSGAAACVLVSIGARRAGSWLAARAPAAPAWLSVEAPVFALAVLFLLAGPRSPLQPSLGPFVNSYLGLHPLPAFTDGVPPHPAFYDTLITDDRGITLLEAPPVRNRAVHYMAALQRWHGHDVRVGTIGPIVPGAPPLESSLYVDLGRITEAPDDLDMLVVHRRIVDEVERYWADVYAAWPDTTGDALLDRHRHYGHDLPSIGTGVIDTLEQVLGQPEHADVDVVVWTLHEGASGRSNGHP